MTSSDVVAQSIFSSYFLLIFGLFALIWHSQRPNIRKAYSLKDADILTFTFLTLASFAHTWFYMFKFMAWSFSTYESATILSGQSTDQNLLPRITAWLVHTDLFEQAWAAVCRGAMNWWWSEMLCLFTVGFWTVFLAIKGPGYSVKRIWAYMLLGQVVAISVASNIFYLALILSRRSLRPKRSQPASAVLWLTVLLSLATVVYSPYTSERVFLPNLLTMHALILIPLLPRPQTWHVPSGPSYRVLYTIVVIISVTLRLRTTLIAVQTLPVIEQTVVGFLRAAWGTLHSHPAQSSIGWDVIWTVISFATWVVMAPLDRPVLASTSTSATKQKDVLREISTES